MATEEQRGTEGAMDNTGPTIKARARLSHPVMHAGTPALVFLRVDVTATEARGETHAPPLDLAVVLDRSGSMEGHALVSAKEAICRLIDGLRKHDRLALVAYDDEVEVVFPRSRIDATVMRAKVKTIESRGCTNLSGGLVAGIQQLGHGRRAVHRVLLLSDGLANSGITDVDKLRDIAHRVTSAGRTVSTFGLGESFDEDLLTAIADAGGGNYYYIASPEDAPGIFQQELGELGSIAAQNLTVDFEPKHCHVAGVLGFAGEKLPAAAGDVQTGATRSVLLALEVPQVPVGALEMGTVTCRWTALDGDLIEETKAIPVQALGSVDVGAVETHVDHDILGAAQLQLVADTHREAVDAARRGDKERFRAHMASATQTLSELGDPAAPLAEPYLRMQEELDARGAEGVVADRDLQLRTHQAQYRTRRSRPL
jgi:Ca-activated chloride channel homolog